MKSIPQAIYEKFKNGDRLNDEELEVGFKHFSTLSTLLFDSGPVFSLSAIEANRVAGELHIYLDNRKCELKSKADGEDRDSKSYQDGYATGIVWTESYRPGGPFCYAPTFLDKPEKVLKANATLIAHRRYMLGFDEGLAAKKAGHQPDASILKCTDAYGNVPEQHQHSTSCLK